MERDPLSDVLRLANANSVLVGGLSASGSWAVEFPPPTRIKFYTVARGSCWCWPAGYKRPIHLAANDVVVHSRPSPFTLYGDLGAQPIHANDLYLPGGPPFVTLGEGSEFCMFGGHVDIDSEFSGPLKELLPRWMHIKGSLPESSRIRWLIEQMVAETTSRLPGAGVASTQLAQLLFIQVLRYHLANAKALRPGLFRALGDAKIKPALDRMHRQPEHPWQLVDLAKSCGMSRTSFAVYFKGVAGVSPLSYLTEWRMRNAQKLLRDRDLTVAELAETFGYASESAFSNAFKRVTGLAPRTYRHRADTRH